MTSVPEPQAPSDPNSPQPGYNKFVADPSHYTNLKDKVLVLTGGANGIGKCTIQLFHEAGGKVAFGDWEQEKGEALAEELDPSGKTVAFVQIDVSKYEDVVKLFKTAWDKFGRVDHAVPVAGIIERGKWFAEDLTRESVEKPESTQTLEVNLFGTAYFTRIAVPYLRDGKKEGENKSITLLSSAAGFRESPGLPMYQCTKHGVQGLMRTLRPIIYKRDGIRINTINPGMTDTQMTSVHTNMIEKFRETGQAINTAMDVAQYVVALAAEETWHGQPLHGKGVYIEGGRGWEIETGLFDVRTMSIWLGKEPTRRLYESLGVVKEGSMWAEKGPVK